MGLLYNLTNWLDHVVEFPGRKKMTQNSNGTVDFQRAEGDIIQNGTPQSATNFNNVETGVMANQVHLLQTDQRLMQVERLTDDLNGTAGQVTLKNTQKYPFNNSGTTVAIKIERNRLDYDVAPELLSSEGGFVEDIIIYDKQLNGFKVKYTGSATQAVVKYIVTGGLY